MGLIETSYLEVTMTGTSEKEKLSELRKNVLSNCTGVVRTLFNFDRHIKDMSKDHLRKVLTAVDELRVICVASEKKKVYSLTTDLNTDKLQLRYLPVEKFDFQTEVLITPSRLYVSDDSDDLIITSAMLINDMKLLFDSLWGQAEVIKN